MKTYDESGNLIEDFELNPDLGYVTTETRVIEHHDAVPEQPQTYKVIPKWANKAGSKLNVRVIDQPYQPAIPAYDDTETVQVYHPYTAKELKEREDQKRAAEEAEAEAEARRREAEDRERAHAEFMEEIPLALAEVATMVAETKEAQEELQQGQDDIMIALGELATMVAENAMTE